MNIKEYIKNICEGLEESKNRVELVGSLSLALEREKNQFQNLINEK